MREPLSQPLPTSDQTESSHHTDSRHEIAVAAQQAFDRFREGFATGSWDGFLDLLTEDFAFWFPAGPYQGWNHGKAKAAEFFQAVSRIFPHGLTLTIERMTQGETTVIFEVRSEGWMLDQPYCNQAAISFDLRGDRVCGYREYLGVIVTR